MTTNSPQIRSIVSINFTLLYATCLGGLAWLSWPHTAQNWQLGVLSILCAMAGLGLAIKGFGAGWRYVTHDIEYAKFNGLGRKPQSDHMADEEALRKSGMIK